MSLKIETPGFVRGNVFWVEAPSDGLKFEPRGSHPMVILSTDFANERSGTLVGAWMTSTPPREMSINVKVSGLSRDAWVKCNQIDCYSKERFGDYIGTLSERDMLAIDKAVTTVLDLPDWSRKHERLSEEKDRAARFFLAEKQKLQNDIDNLKKQLEEMSRKEAQIEELTRRLVDADVKEVLYRKAVEELAELKRAPVVVVEEPAVLPEVSEKANVNEVDLNGLVSATGMSAKTAQNVISYRKKNGPFKSLDDLMKVSRFGSGCLKKYGGFLTV